MADANCENPCGPCHFGGHQQVENAAGAVGQDVRMDLPADCSKLTTENREPIQGIARDEGGEQLRPVQTGNPPCYMPQAGDALGGGEAPSGEASGLSSATGPLGPWATGRVDWSPLAGLTGTRPIVDKYTITRYSEGEWRQRNADLLERAYLVQDECSLLRASGTKCAEKARADTDKGQAESTRRCQARSTEVHRWKCELERAIDAAGEELRLLSEQRDRLRQAAAILTVPEAIAAECLDVRTTRLEPELVRDKVEEQLVAELALTSEIRSLFTRTLQDIEAMIVEETAAKQRLEYDWSDKRLAFDAQSLNVALNNRSTVVMFHPGATRFPADQSTHNHWEHFTRESLEQAETTRQRAVALRGTLDAILANASRDLRTQADRVDNALADRISCTDQLVAKLELELKKVLQQQVDMEATVLHLQDTIRRMDRPMKVVQTRLDNRMQLPRVENCRDESELGLIDEVKSISQTVAALNAELGPAEASKAKLLAVRSDLERELMMKLRTLQIDKERIQLLRSHYPSATALSGY